MSVPGEIAEAHRAGVAAWDTTPRGQAPRCPYDGTTARGRVLARAWRVGVLSRVDPALRQQ